jgi:putative oxidoreductase
MKPVTKEMSMKIASITARYLLGLIFLTFGLNGFLHFIPMPPPTGVAAQFFGALFVSRFYMVVFALQILPAILLLANRYVPLALTILAAVIFNILCFHIFMAPAGLPMAFFVAVLWVVIFVDVRPAFSGLFQARLQPRV